MYDAAGERTDEWLRHYDTGDLCGKVRVLLQSMICTIASVEQCAPEEVPAAMLHDVLWRSKPHTEKIQDWEIRGADPATVEIVLAALTVLATVDATEQ
ncbi:hypothetical protein [Longimycelium tulufanense]|uniref:hypothetical protein n=1 Tax=Longimycelium tulufanense TaxID=907463 RepID=UPI0016664098|nr:hypothetical protein [Longimycelium tulufanense]